MNRRSISILAVTLVLLACDEVNELTTIDFNSTLNFVLNASETSTGQSIPYNETVIFDATAVDADFDRYADNIEDIDITSLEFSIDNYSGPQDGVYLSDGIFGWADVGASSFASESSCSVDNLLIINSDAYFDVFPCNQILDRIAGHLVQEQAVKLFLQGTLQSAPVSFDLNVRMAVKVTARAL